MPNLIETARELLANGTVDIVIGYESAPGQNSTRPFFAHKPEDADRLVFNHYALNNLSVYLTKMKPAEGKKIGIVAKGCDIRSIVMLIKESQIKREDIYIIGMNCSGVATGMNAAWSADAMQPKCTHCMVHTPPVYDVLLGEAEQVTPPQNKRMAQLMQLEAMSEEERWNFWQAEFEKCIKCYACRQNCPLCYCEQCIADKSVPRWIESSATQRGNLAWNVIRAFHLAGRCVGCNECERACPMDIPLSLLNMKMGMIAKQEFDYATGMDMESPTLVGTYNVNDREDYIM
jgi:ferredoxin